MTATAQDFTTYAGDDLKPVFTVLDGAGAPLNIASAQEITWKVQRSPSDASPALLKTKTGGAITFVNTGSDGQFQVQIDAADTTPLSGFYFHRATVTDANGKVSTVTLGRMEIGPVTPGWTYSGDPASSDKDAVRFWLGDTDESAARLQDAEILFALSLYPAALRAAAYCARTLGGRYASRVSRKIGDLSINFGDLSKQFYTLADELDGKADITGLKPYAGGVSISDKRAVAGNADRAAPPFRERQFDNKSGPQNTTGENGEGW